MSIFKGKPPGETIIILLYFALKPLYFGASGFLQISDVFLLLSLVYLLVKQQGKIHFVGDNAEVIKIFIFMVAYQCLINVIWGIVTGDSEMNRHDLYYIFNFLAFAGVIHIGQRAGVDLIKRAIGLGSLIATIITAIGLLLFSDAGSRGTGFFNNPNQLGYFAVIMLTVIILCKEQMHKLQIVALFALSFWAVIASLSKAAIIAYFAEVVVLILFYQNNRSVKRLIAELALIAVVGAGVYLLLFSNINWFSGNSTIFHMRQRILYMSQENDSGLAYGRGYARVAEILPNIVWGTGEGAYERFNAMHGTEVHSTYVSLLTCYGLVGFIGYLVIFIKCMGRGRAFLQSLAALFGLVLYAVTHNGIRNTLIWMIMALLLLSNEKESDFHSNRIIQ